MLVNVAQGRMDIRCRRCRTPREKVSQAMRTDDRTLSQKVQSECFCLQSRMTARAITREYNQKLAPAGLEITEFSLLGALLATNTASITKLAHDLAFERTTLVRNLKRMADRGLIEQVSQRGRAVRYMPTAQGLALIQRAYPLWQQIQASLEANLGVNRKRALNDLASLRKAARHRPPER